MFGYAWASGIGKLGHAFFSDNGHMRVRAPGSIRDHPYSLVSTVYSIFPESRFTAENMLTLLFGIQVDSFCNKKGLCFLLRSNFDFKNIALLIKEQL